MRITKEGKWAGVEWRVKRATVGDNANTGILARRLVAELKNTEVFTVAHTYARFVTQGTGSADNIQLYVRGLRTLDGTAYDIPEFGADIKVHLRVFRLFQDTDPELTDAPFVAIEAADAPLGEAHFQPPTEESKGDPLAESSAKKPKTG